MAFLLVKVCALAACSPAGSVCLYLMACYAQDKMACHLHPILCTWDAEKSGGVPNPVIRHKASLEKPEEGAATIGADCVNIVPVA